MRFKLGITTAVLAGVAFAAPVQAADEIVLGLSYGKTGLYSTINKTTEVAVDIAVAEINAAGGVLGKQLEIVRYDTQSDNRRFQEFAKRLIKKDKVDVVFGAFSSASRESIRGIMEKNKMYWRSYCKIA